MPKVALFLTHDVYDNYEDSQTVFGSQATEWTEVTDEELEILKF